jgi:hypothetical protein
VTDPIPNEQQAATTPGGAWLAFRVFDEPTKVFQQLAVSPRFLVPLVCLVVATAIYAFGIPGDVLRDQTRDRLQSFVEDGRIPAEQADAQIEGAASTRSRALIFGAGAVGGTIALLIVAGVLALIFGALGAEPLKFKREFSLVLHANMVAIAGTVLLVILMVFAGFRQPQISLGFLFSQDQSSYLYRFMNLITPFGLWNVYLLALGNAIMTKAKGIGGAIAIVGGLWLLTRLGFAAFGGLFGG